MIVLKKALKSKVGAGTLEGEHLQCCTALTFQGDATQAGGTMAQSCPCALQGNEQQLPWAGEGLQGFRGREIQNEGASKDSDSLPETLGAQPLC